MRPYVSASVPDGITCTIEDDRLFSCTVRDLGPAGDLVSWTLRVVPVSGGTLSTTVGVTSNLAETTPADNTVIASTTVNATGRELRVINTYDDGEGSLRQAIRDSNGDAGDTDRIVFDIGGGGVQTITLATPLPAATQPVIIDATTQPGYAGLPMVELTGNGLNPAPG